MKKVLRVCLLLFVMTAAERMAAAEEAPDITPRQSEIIRTIMDTQNGYITRDLYDEFWTALPLTPEERTMVTDYLRAFMLKGQNYVRATWTSALLSQRAGRYTESGDYRRAKQDSLDALHAIPGAPSEPLEQSIARSEALIAAAAENRPYELGNGQSAYITEDLVASVISGIDGTLDRINLLLMPDWQPRQQELAFPEPDLKMLLPWHLVRSVTVQELENGFKVPMTQYVGAFDATTFVNLGYADYSSVDVPFDYRKAMFGAVRGGFGGTGLTLTQSPTREKWRGYDSVIAWGTGLAEGKPVAGYMRVFRPTGRKGLTMIILLKDGSLTDLTGMVDALEHKLTVIE